MPLTFLPTQPAPTWAHLNARIEDLPFGMAGLLRGALNQAGTTAAHLLYLADAMDEARREVAEVFPGGCAQVDHFAAMASILRDAAPLFPHPPRLPAAPISAMDADRRGRARA
jgi:hypothetical protein